MSINANGSAKLLKCNEFINAWALSAALTFVRHGLEKYE